jgi:hypothetical protein
MAKHKFPLGQSLATPGALKALEQAGQNVAHYLVRHQAGDWGDLCSEDVQENEYSLERALRLLSAYTLPTGERIWVITEADRSSTTVLLPEEY